MVEAVRERLDPAGVLDPYRVCERFGWVVRLDRLDARTGGQQAALLPRWEGGFTLVVDPDLTPIERHANAETADVLRLRVAHELAHTLFYSETAPPRRAIPASRAEEDFCDAFAWALLFSTSLLQPV